MGITLKGLLSNLEQRLPTAALGLKIPKAV